MQCRSRCADWARHGSLFIVSERARAGAFIKPGPKSLFDYYRDQPKYDHCIPQGWLLGKEVGDLISQRALPWAHHQGTQLRPCPSLRVRSQSLRPEKASFSLHLRLSLDRPLRKHLWWGPHAPEPQHFLCRLSLEFKYCVWNQRT